MVQWEGLTMVLEWKEKEHKDIEHAALHSAPSVQALWQSGILKFFCTSPMQASVHFLEVLIGYLEHDLGALDLQGEILEVALEDIYFIMGLYR